MNPPGVTTDRLDGWRRVEETTERPFSAGPVSVTAGTIRYERATGDPLQPFFFASRLRIRPPTVPNPTLTRLVERQARSGFKNRLAERNIEAVDHANTREIAVDDPRASRATLSVFRGECRIEGGRVTTTVPVEALLAVWEAGEYLLAGGAYPLTDDPGRDRRELLGLIRGTRPPEAVDGT